MITLSNLSQATAQQVFDQVATHLLTQMKQSKNKGECLYRGPKGLKCAAGCLIADNEYDSSWETMSWDYVGYQGDYGYHQELINTLQLIHDESVPENWKELLIGISTEYQLNTDCIQQLELSAGNK